VTQLFWQPCRVLNDFWSDRCRDVSRPSSSALRVQHLLRCSPLVDAQGPGDFDSLLRTALSRITTSTSSDSQWLQASLPVKSGGLGIRRVSSLALPAFLATAASTLPLQDEILGGSQPLPDESAESLKGRWEASYGPALSDQSATKQSSWDRPVFWPTLPRWRRLEPRRFSELVSSQHKHHTAATGFWRCRSLLVAYTTRRRGRPHRCSAEAGFRARQSTYLPLWQFG